MITVLQIVFWASIAVVAGVTVGYPLFLAACGPFVRRKWARDERAEPTVTLIIAAYNEEAVIAQKLENALLLDYPADKLEIVVASDGSTDGTDAIVESFRDRGIGLVRFPRTGKTGMQNEMAKLAKGEILVFSDANAMYDPQAIRKLVRNFADPSIGGVCGQLVYGKVGEGAGASERLYWEYEKFMRLRESEISSLVGANGSIYAVRKSDYVALDEDSISDFLEPLALVRAGKRMVYEPEAISVEPASKDYDVEFRRKVRILVRSIRGLLSMRDLLNPLRYGVFALQLLMHKMLRFLMPLFLASAAVALAALAALNTYRMVLLLVVLVAAASVLVAKYAGGGKRNPIFRILHVVYYYQMVNIALVRAWINVLRGNKMRLWVPERSGG